MLILASKSPTRKTLLEAVGIDFSVSGAPVNEREIETELLGNGATLKDVALELAKAKALAVSRLNPQAIVLGADQTLECGALQLHKPDSRETAYAQLVKLRGRTHQLHAAAAMAINGEVIWSGIDSAALTMTKFSKEELDQVMALEGDAILTSVGGYRLEGPSVRLFESIKGDYFTILGLPLLAVLSALRLHAPEILSKTEKS